MWKRLTYAEWITIAGSIGSTVGIALWLGEQSVLKLSDYIKIISPAVLLAGLSWSLRDIYGKLEILKDKSSHTATAIQLLETADIARSNPEGLHVIVTSNIISDTVSLYAKSLSNDLALFPERKRMELYDYWPIHNYLDNLVDSLPDGACWCGITLLEKRDAWLNPVDDKFKDFTNKIRERVQEKRLHVYRIYYFHTREAYKNLTSEIKKEVECGINIKIIIGPEHNCLPPDDISLLWIPRNRRSLKDSQLVRENLRMVDDENCFQKLCAVQFGVKYGSVLTNLILFSPASKEFATQKSRYVDYWYNVAEKFPK
jgi:hypothetical protein